MGVKGSGDDWAKKIIGTTFYARVGQSDLKELWIGSLEKGDVSSIKEIDISLKSDSLFKAGLLCG